MYSVGDYVVHPGQGVCRVEDVSPSPDAFYRLLPIGPRHPVHISFPVLSEGRLRPVLSPEEARKLIDDYPTLQPEEYEARNNSLEEQHYRDEIRTGSCRDTVRIVKTFRSRISDLSAQNKKAPQAYGRILSQASERSCAELAVALGCTPEDVAMLFRERMGEVDEGN